MGVDLCQGHPAHAPVSDCTRRTVTNPRERKRVVVEVDAGVTARSFAAGSTSQLRPFSPLQLPAGGVRLAGDDVIARAAEDVDPGVGAFLDPCHGEELAALGSDVLATANSLGRWSQPQRHSGEALVPFIGG